MKVLQVINNLGSGGAEKLLVDLIPLMNKMENLQADILLITDGVSSLKYNCKVDFLENIRF